MLSHACTRVQRTFEVGEGSALLLCRAVRRSEIQLGAVDDTLVTGCFDVSNDSCGLTSQKPHQTLAESDVANRLGRIAFTTRKLRSVHVAGPQLQSVILPDRDRLR